MVKRMAVIGVNVFQAPAIIQLIAKDRELDEVRYRCTKQEQ